MDDPHFRPDPTETPADSPTATAQWVGDILRDRIVKGDFPPGSRLVERRISAELEVSRTPVREALKLLHAEGLIDISRNRGAQVLHYSAEEALHLFEVIAALESLAAQLLARTITPEALDEIEEMHDRMMTYHKVGNHTDYFDTNSEIHDFIVDRCGNTVLPDTHKRLIARARRGRYLAIMDPARLEQAVGEHETLMVALRARDADAAASIWRQHLVHTGQSVVSILSAAEAAG